MIDARHLRDRSEENLPEFSSFHPLGFRGLHRIIVVERDVAAKTPEKLKLLVSVMFASRRSMEVGTVRK